MAHKNKKKINKHIPDFLRTFYIMYDSYSYLENTSVGDVLYKHLELVCISEIEKVKEREVSFRSEKNPSR